MADKSILFSGPMVRALLAGTKTQTRRGLADYDQKIAQEPAWEAAKDSDGVWRIIAETPSLSGSIVPRLRYSVGDRLYVREHWRVDSCLDRIAPRDMPSDRNNRPCVHYKADGRSLGVLEPGRFRQGMHMPRWASRITLTVTDVRVERLQDISEADAIAEGIEDVTREVAAGDPSLRFWRRYRDGGWNGYVDTAVGSYASLWTEINGPGSWEANPWVAAYTFTVERGNIDRLAGAA